MGFSIELPISQPDQQLLAGKLTSIEGPWTAESFTPHLSLAVIREEADGGILRAIVDELATRIQPFRVRFSSIGLFPGRRPVLFLNAVANPRLIAAHELSASLLVGASIEPIGYYQPGFWTPHLTLSTGMPALQLVPKVKDLLRLDFTGDYEFDTIDLIEFHPKERLARLRLAAS